MTQESRAGQPSIDDGEDVVIVERSTLTLDSHCYRALRKSETTQRLLEDGVLSFLHSSRIPFGIRASCYVGQSLLEDGRRIIIREKTPGALRSLFSLAAADDIRAIDLPSAVASQSDVLEICAERFLEYLGDYLRHGCKHRSENVALVGAKT